MAKKIINTLNRSLKTSDLLNHKDSTFKDSLNENLKKTISTALKANPELRADIEKLDLDAEVLKNNSLTEVIAAIKDKLDDKHKDTIGDFLSNTKETDANPTVNDLLGFDLPLAENPILSDSLLSYNASKLGSMVKLKGLEAKTELTYLLNSPPEQKRLLIDQWKVEKKWSDEEVLKLENSIGLLNAVDNQVDWVVAFNNGGVSKTEDLAFHNVDSIQSALKNGKVEIKDKAEFENFAGDMLLTIEREYPSAYFMHRVVNKPEWIGLDESDKPKVSKDFKTFYEKNASFDIKNEPIISVETGLMNDKIKGVDASPELVKELTQAQQALQMSPDTDIAALLMAKQFNVHKVVNTTHNSIMRELSIDAETAIGIKMKAQELHDKSMNAFLEFRDIHSNPFVRNVISNLHKVGDGIRGGIGKADQWESIKVSNGLKELNSFEDLFGSQNYCECESCQSVLSPAAYFVDLMSFVEKRVLKTTVKNNGISESILEEDNPIHLKVRRPDLWKLPLTCENTNDRIPYIEVVNEVLTAFVDKQLGHNPNVAERLLTEKPDQEFLLPFNLKLEDVRTWLSYFKVNRLELLQFLHPSPNVAQQRAMNQERLHLSKEMYDVIVDENLDASIDKNVLAFRISSGLNADETQKLANLKFWDNKLTIEQIKDNSDIQSFRLEFKTNVAKWQGKMHRLIRLWKSSTWSLTELDIVLQTFSINHSNLNVDAIDKIALFREIQDKTALSVDAVSGILSGISQTNSEGKMLSWDLILPLGWANNRSINIADLQEGVDEEAVKMLLELQGVFAVTAEDIVECATFLSAKVGEPFDFSTTHLDVMFRYIQLYKWTQADTFSDFVQVLEIWDGTNNKKLNLSAADIASFVQYFQTLALAPADIIYIWGKGLSISAVNEEDKTALKAPDIQALFSVPDFLDNQPFEKICNVWLGVEINVLNYYRRFLGITNAEARSLCEDLGNANSQDQTFTAFSNLKSKIERLNFVFENCKIESEKRAEIANLSASNEIFTLGFTQWSNTNWVLALQKLGNWISETKSINGFNILETLAHFNPTAEITLADQRNIAKWKKVSLSQVQTTVSASSSIFEIQAMMDKLGWMKLLNMNGESLNKFKLNNPLKNQSELLQNAIRSKYESNDTWETETQDYRNALSSKLRDALCNFVIFHKKISEKNFGFKDKESLYQYFLLDVDMGDCFTLPKIVIATNSLQVYIHRCIMGLEGSADEKTSVLLDLDEMQEWEWRKNYRVWEANRKIFLYPENYAEAEIRDNKSPEFKELEDELLQQKLDLEVVENAYKKYLEKVMTLAELRMAGAYFDKAGNRIYLFGKTNKQPTEFYYRNVEFLESGGVIWSNWEKMNISIPAPDISAIMHNGKLHIFWTSNQRKDISTMNEGTSSINQYTYDIFLNYSYLTVEGKWSPPQKVDLGHRSNSPFDAFMRIEDYKNYVLNSNTNNPSLKSSAEAVRENALKDFETTVYRKPYPLASNDKKSLNFLHIWTDQKDALEQRYKYSKITVDAFKVSVKIKVDLKIFSIEDDVEFSFDRIDRTVSTASSPNQVQIPTNITISPLTYNYNFGDDKLSITMTFEKQSSGEYRFKLRTSGNGSNQMFFFKEPNTEIKSGDVTLFHQVDYVPVSKIDYNLEKVDMANQKKIKLSTKLIASSNYEPEYNSYYDNFTNFYVTTGNNSFTNASTACRIQQKDIVSVLTTPVKNDPNDAYDLNPKHIQLLWDKISGGLEELMDTNNSQRHLSDQVNYNNSFGNYFYELFFHIPMRIADHLNAMGKYKEANYWYGFIYNPTAIKDKFEQLAFPQDVNWRFTAFRNLSIQKLSEIYSNPETIEMYRRFPGNPHAIARMRVGAYPKHVVMKYLDNLLDWADNLFEQFTPESTSEARHLYSVVKTILGNKPQSTGDCSDEKVFTYDSIKKSAENEFIYNLFSTTKHTGYESNSKEPIWTKTRAEEDTDTHMFKPYTMGEVKYSAKSKAKITFDYQNNVSTNGKSKVGFAKVKNYRKIKSDSRHSTFKPNKDVFKPTRPVPVFDLEIDLAFCFPHNEDLLNYWNRVDDRIYKLDHCLDINGIKKEMPAFAPEIDPMLLARMVAGGLSFDEIIGALNSRLPYHRFGYLVEKAKQYTGVVQGFGQALFSAIEKKDAEELTLLRARHEQNILSLTTQVKKKQVEQARTGLQTLEESKKGIELRKAHFEGLIEDDLTPWERTEQIAKWTAGGLRIGESVFQIAAAITALVPQVGSPFSMKYGGVELSGSSAKFAGSLDAIAKMADNVAMLAGMEAGHQRRAQEWQFQVATAAQELVGVSQQIRNAEIALAMAETDLEIHEKNIEQYQEMYEFYTNKFSGFNHYTFQVRQLQQLYRMAYNLANDAALQAQKSFEFERFGTDTGANFIKNDNWNNEKLGLLAGERLNLQLMQMEQEYVNTDKRKIEITQHFSMLQLAPEKLMELKMNGECSDFTIPEAAFDLVYPGHYRRIIKSVRISMPCIAGPYTNIGATLSLGNNKIRSKTTEALVDFNFTGCATVATSSAQNDGGQFELNFRDERYLPFEGAGAVSSWTLSLPTAVHTFDYNTISDVVFHISYTAEYDGVFKNTVETGLKAGLNTLNGTGLFRIFSMRHDFPVEWSRLNDSNNSANVILELRREHFPYFANVKNIQSFGTHAFTLDSDNNFTEESDNLGIIKKDKMKIEVPIDIRNGNFNDLIFLVKYNL